MNSFNQKLFFSSRTDEWSTPLDFFSELASEFNFVLDPCALSTSKKADTWYGPDHSDVNRRDGLSGDWIADVKNCGGGDVYMNPPYGREIGHWLRKASEVSSHGVTIVCLLPARTDTKWFHEYCIDNECRFIKGRLKFGGHPNPAPFPSVIVIMRPKV